MNKIKRDLTFDELTRHLMDDNSPSEYFNSLRTELGEYPMSMIGELKNVEQSIKYHPEGNVWNHTMLVVDEAAKVRGYCNDPRVFMWAALLHDIGKPNTTKLRKGRITSYDHDIEGAKLSRNFLDYYTKDSEFINKVSMMVKYHMHMLYVLKNLSFGNPKQMIKETDTHDIALLCRCDRLGRKGADIEAEEQNYRKFLEKIDAI